MHKHDFHGKSLGCARVVIPKHLAQDIRMLEEEDAIGDDIFQGISLITEWILKLN